jgi:hypothetical protein
MDGARQRQQQAARAPPAYSKAQSDNVLRLLASPWQVHVSTSSKQRTHHLHSITVHAALKLGQNKHECGRYTSAPDASSARTTCTKQGTKRQCVTPLDQPMAGARQHQTQAAHAPPAQSMHYNLHGIVEGTSMLPLVHGRCTSAPAASSARTTCIACITCST